MLCRYLLSLVDDSPTVRAMAEHLVVDAMRKAPSLAHNHFLEAAFVLNNAKGAWLAMRHRSGGGGGSQAMSIASSGQLPRALQLQLAAPTADAQSRRFVIYKVCPGPPAAARCECHCSDCTGGHGVSWRAGPCPCCSRHTLPHATCACCANSCLLWRAGSCTQADVVCAAVRGRALVIHAPHAATAASVCVRSRVNTQQVVRVPGLT